MTTQVLVTGVFPPSIVQQQAVGALYPLFGCNTQTTDPQTSAWIPVPAGSYLQLALAISVLTATAPAVGTLAVYLETCNQIDPITFAALDTPRFLGGFRQTPGAALPSTTQLTGAGVCDNYVRVVSVPGQDAGQTASWAVQGRAIEPHTAML